METPVTAPVPANAPTETLFVPPGTQRLGTERKKNALIGIGGKAGVGKSHLVRQLLLDPGYGPREVLILMAEDSTVTYDVDDAQILEVDALENLEAKVEQLIAKPAGSRLPKVIVMDSVSGVMDNQRRKYRLDPIISNKGNRDKLAEFGEQGYMGMDILARLRHAVEADIIVMVTMHEAAGGTMPEFAVDGKLLPKNFARLTDVMLYLRSEPGRYQTGQTVRPWPWRTISRPDGEGAGVYIDRYFHTQDNGEFLGKGHHALDIREWAYLPDILRKIHGQATSYLGERG